jgi:hypothetical protein
MIANIRSIIVCIISTWCKNKYECEYWADLSKRGVKFYKDATEKSLALAQKYLDSICNINIR